MSGVRGARMGPVHRAARRVDVFRRVPGVSGEGEVDIMSDDIHPKVQEAGRLLIEGDIEEAMEALSAFFAEDAARNDHPAVKALLESCRDSARSIGFEWYASLK